MHCLKRKRRRSEDLIDLEEALGCMYEEEMKGESECGGCMSICPPGTLLQCLGSPIDCLLGKKLEELKSVMTSLHCVTFCL